jgi:hypothetical protein
MVAAGPMADVRNRVLVGRRLRVELVDPDDVKLFAVRDQVAGRPGVIKIELIENGLEVAVEEEFADQDLLMALVQAGVAVRSFAPVTGDLSEAFMRLTGPGVERTR